MEHEHIAHSHILLTYLNNDHIAHHDDLRNYGHLCKMFNIYEIHLQSIQIIYNLTSKI